MKLDEKRRMLFVISIIFVCFLSLSFVSAETNQSEDILKDSLSYKSFAELNSLIQDSSGVIELTDDYKFNSTTDQSYSSNGIFISKPITINGNGHSIDAIGESKYLPLQDLM